MSNWLYGLIMAPDVSLFRRKSSIWQRKRASAPITTKPTLCRVLKLRHFSEWCSACHDARWMNTMAVHRLYVYDLCMDSMPSWICSMHRWLVFLVYNERKLMRRSERPLSDRLGGLKPIVPPFKVSAPHALSRPDVDSGLTITATPEVSAPLMDRSASFPFPPAARQRIPPP